MLKWTCRLRDLFESKGYQTSRWNEKRCSEIREVEFAGRSFPKQFRWETFRESFNFYEERVVTEILSRTTSNVHRLVPAIDLNSEEARKIRSKCGRPTWRLRRRTVDVWWLSPTLFVSWMKIFLDEVRLKHFEIVFLEGGCARTFYVYSLSAFGDRPQVPSSLLPIDFCRHLIALLPANYFRSISIGCSLGSNVVPLEYFLYFLSIIPHDTPLPPPCRTDESWACLGIDEPWTRFHLSLGRKIGHDELRSIFSHQFHPAVMMLFYSSVFDESVSMDVFCHLLREARYLHAVGLPRCLIRNDNSPKLSFEKIRCKAAVLTSFLPCGSCSSAFLFSFAKNLAVTDIQMDVEENMWAWTSNRQQSCLALRSFLSPFFTTEKSALERLSIRFQENERGYNSDVTTLWIPGIVSACASKDLCFFNVAVKVWGRYRNLDRIQSWDQGLFPSLALNYCRKNLMKPVEALPLAIKAVNKGVIYRKTTDHLPSNTKTANASVIFYFLKARTQ
jgi:hypothetical protein